VRVCLAGRGLDFRQLHLNIIDASKALSAGVRKYCGDRSAILHCQLHKRRNALGHFADEKQSGWDRRLANVRSYKEAKAALLRIQDKLDHVNPSAAAAWRRKRWRPAIKSNVTLGRLRAVVAERMPTQ
jgi:hypothetical protein